MRRAVARFRYGDVEVGLDRHGANRSTVWARNDGDEYLRHDYHARDYAPPHYPDGSFPVARENFVGMVGDLLEDIDAGLHDDGGAS